MHRSDYLAASQEDMPAAHRTYYAQFVDHDVIELVLCRIGSETLHHTPHLDLIPLRRWDNMAPAIWALTRQRLAMYGEPASMGTAVCIAKEAARQYLERGSSQG
jgi:hypothetical protein